MKRSLSHLPKRKREELKLVAQTIVEMVPAAQMIILFGSHPRERLGMAQAFFEQWLTFAESFLRQFEHAMRDKDYRIAAFLLHQGAENLYHGLLLVFTGYKPKLHNLEKLIRLTAPFGQQLLPVFPIITDKDRNRFLLLKRAYVEARYEPGFRINKEDLEYLAKRVQLLREMVTMLCERRIESYEKEAADWREHRA